VINKKQKRLRRTRKLRCRVKELQLPRLSVHRTPRHIYAQVIMPDGKVVASASTLTKEIKQECVNGGNVAAAKIVGREIARRCQHAQLSKVAFDRSGFKYHGRIRALAEAAREQGLDF